MITLRAWTAWTYTGVYWMLFMPFYLLTFRTLPIHWVMKVSRFWGYSTLKILNVRLELVNSNPLEHQAPRVFVCNHQSSLDILWGAAVSPPAPLVMGKKELAYIPFVNLIWWAFRFIYVDRKNTQRAIASLQGVANVIRKDSRSLIVAPEGTRTSTGEILPFKKGAFHLAIQSGAPVFPVVIAGAFELMPKSRFTSNPGVMLIKFLPPVETRGLKNGDAAALAEKVRTLMIAEYAELRKRLLELRTPASL